VNVTDEMVDRMAAITAGHLNQILLDVDGRTEPVDEWMRTAAERHNALIADMLTGNDR